MRVRVLCDDDLAVLALEADGEAERGHPREVVPEVRPVQRRVLARRGGARGRVGDVVELPGAHLVRVRVMLGLGLGLGLGLVVELPRTHQPEDEREPCGVGRAAAQHDRACLGLGLG